MPAAGVVLMFLALSKFVAAVYDSDDSMLNDILEGCYGALRERGMVTNAKAEGLLLSLLQVPLQVRRNTCIVTAACESDSTSWGPADRMGHAALYTQY
jgi:hypothetical protein